MVVNQIVHRLRTQNFRKGLLIQQLVVHLLRTKTKQLLSRLLCLKVAGGHFFVHGFLAGIRGPNLGEQLQRLSLKRQKSVRHLIQILHLQKVLRELVAHVPHPIQTKLPVQAEQLKVDMNICQITKELIDLV